MAAEGRSGSRRQSLGRRHDDPGAGRAWSRGEGEMICDRPGCFEAPARALSGESRYCSAECRTAVRRVVDRERKWFGRLTRLGRFKRGREYARAREKRRESRFPPAGADPPDRT